LNIYVKIGCKDNGSWLLAVDRWQEAVCWGKGSLIGKNQCQWLVCGSITEKKHPSSLPTNNDQPASTKNCRFQKKTYF